MQIQKKKNTTIYHSSEKNWYDELNRDGSLLSVCEGCTGVWGKDKETFVDLYREIHSLENIKNIEVT